MNCLEIYGYINDDIILYYNKRHFKFSCNEQSIQKINIINLKTILCDKILNNNYTCWTNYNTLFINILIQTNETTKEMHELTCNEMFPYIHNKYNIELNNLSIPNYKKELIEKYINDLCNKINNLQGENTHLKNIIDLYDM